MKRFVVQYAPDATPDTGGTEFDDYEEAVEHAADATESARYYNPAHSYRVYDRVTTIITTHCKRRTKSSGGSGK